jgi:hypothetical protein
MFSSKNKSFNDSRVRFQHQAFKRQLRQARQHKRVPPKSQGPASANILKILGKGSPWAKFGFSLAVALLAYFIYIPNFLYVKNVEISGLDQKNSQDIKFLLAQYFAGQKFFPKNNSVILPAKALASYLLSADKNLLKVNIDKQLPGTLKISGELRKNEFLISSPEGRFTVSNDGLVSADSASSTAEAALTIIKIRDNAPMEPGSPYPNQQQLEAAAFLAGQLQEKINARTDYFEVQNFKQTDITAATKDGYRLMLDYGGDLPDTLNKLRLLFNSIAPQDLKRLAYVDMRIKNRGYVCLKGASCAVSPPVVKTATSTASSTPDNLP